MYQYNTIRKLYVSKMNENKQIIPTKYTRNPPDHRRAGINGGQTVDKRWTNDGQPMDKRRES